MTEREMFIRSFERPSNYFELCPDEQYEIDRTLRILDWKGLHLTSKDLDKFKFHYK